MSQNGDEQEVSRTLFELASTRRATILFGVQKSNLKMQQIAKSFDMTLTETFRHLQRLSEASLIEKKPDGTYSITPLGNLAAGFLEGFNFVLDNKKYFLEHDPSCLPYDFVNRLGELSNSKFYGSVLASFNKVRQMVFDAQEYIWVIADQIDSSHTQITNQKVAKGLEFKFIMQEDLTKVLEVAPDFERFKKRRCLLQIPLAILINETEAFVAIRGTNGTIDYCGFVSADERFRKWAKDVFTYYWEKANPWFPNHAKEK